ncbi:hypothetical protein SprV_0301252700 [Sparganum proliferum]
MMCSGENPKRQGNEALVPAILLSSSSYSRLNKYTTNVKSNFTICRIGYQETGHNAIHGDHSASKDIAKAEKYERIREDTLRQKQRNKIYELNNLMRKAENESSEICIRQDSFPV